MLSDQFIAVLNEEQKITNVLKSETIYAIMVRENSIVIMNKVSNSNLESFFKKPKDIQKALKSLAISQGFKSVEDCFLKCKKKDNGFDRDIYIVPEEVLYVEKFGEHGSKIYLNHRNETMFVETSISDIFKY